MHCFILAITSNSFWALFQQTDDLNSTNKNHLHIIFKLDDACIPDI